jgi:hypothetical protein
MRSKYQKLIAVRGAVLEIRSCPQSHANILVKNPGKRVTRKDRATINAINRMKIATAKTLFWFEAIYEGIKLWVNEPSAKMRRKRLGNLNAIKKISLHIFAPNTDVIKMSRPSPVTREMRIPKELENIDLNIVYIMP